MKFRAKPVEIEAVQWLDTDESWAAVCDLVGNAEEVFFRNPGGMLSVETPSGRMSAPVDYWITKDAAGHFRCCAPGLFETNYEAVS